jgi:dephospho-CoA kinase
MMSTKEQKIYNGIIIFGEMSSGKDTLADILLKLDSRCNKYNLGNVVRQFFSIIKVSPHFRGKTRVLGQVLADKLREVHPEILNDYCLSLIYERWEKFFEWNNDNVKDEDFNNVIMEQLSLIKEKEIPVVVGGRTYTDFNYWSSKNFLTVGLVCNFENRCERLRLRDGEEVAKNSNFKHNTEADVGDIARNKCNVLIDNNGDLEHLKSQANTLLKYF